MATVTMAIEAIHRLNLTAPGIRDLLPMETTAAMDRAIIKTINPIANMKDPVNKKAIAKAAIIKVIEAMVNNNIIKIVID